MTYLDKLVNDAGISRTRAFKVIKDAGYEPSEEYDLSKEDTNLILRTLVLVNEAITTQYNLFIFTSVRPSKLIEGETKCIHNMFIFGSIKEHKLFVDMLDESMISFIVKKRTVKIRRKSE